MLTLLTLTLLAGTAQPADQPAPTPPPAQTPTPTPTPTPAPTPAAAHPPAFADAKALLIALEKADEGLDQLQAGVRYDVLEVDVDDRTIRMGDLFFDRVKDEAGRPVRRFAVRFSKLMVGTSTRDDVRIHCFDGRWYAEKAPAEKKINRKEVAPPGELVDPLKIGEGPLPIPIGQKHEDILARYDADLRPVEDGLDAKDASLKGFVGDCVQVRLVPTASYRDRDRFKEIRLWYGPEEVGKDDAPTGRLLPRLARTVGRNGNITLVQLVNVRVNKRATIDPELMVTTAPAGWDVTETPFRRPAPEQKPQDPPKPESAPKDGGKAEEKKDADVPSKDAPK